MPRHNMGVENKEPKEYIEDVEDIVVEIVKAPFKIVNKLFDSLFGF